MRENTYLMVLAVQGMKLPDGRVAIEGAFLEHLRLLKRTLPIDNAVLTVMGPLMSQEHYSSHASHLATFSPAAEGISFVPLEPKSVGPLSFYFKYFAEGCRTIWSAAKSASVVHAGPSHAFRMREFIGIVAAIINKKPSIFVVDVDWREDAKMNFATGRWNYRNYLMDKYIYQPFFSLQVRLAARYCSLVLLKGQGLVDTYGHNKPHVRNLLDAAHSHGHIIPPAELSVKLERLINPNNPLNLVYFGRLTAYKGIDRCLLIMRALEDQHPGRFNFRIIGAGEDADMLKTMAAQLDLSEAVQFLGPRTFGTELFEELRACDIAMATPLAPDAPRSALDAMCSGLPLLAFDTEYYASLRDNSNAVVTATWNDTDDAVRALIKLDNDRTELARLASNAVKFAASNTQDEWLKRRAEWISDYCFNSTV